MLMYRYVVVTTGLGAIHRPQSVNKVREKVKVRENYFFISQSSREIQHEEKVCRLLHDRPELVRVTLEELL